MTTTVDELAMRRESDAIAARRADCIRQHPATVSKQCPPHAALLHRLAALITEEALPPATVTVRFTTTGAEVDVDTTGDELVENVVRRYAAALDLPPVTEAPYDAPGGFAATSWSTSSYDGRGCWVKVHGYELLPTICGCCGKGTDTWPGSDCEEPADHVAATRECDCGDLVTIAEAISHPSKHRRCNLIGADR